MQNKRKVANVPVNKEIQDFITRKGTDFVIDEMITKMGLNDFMENVAWVVNNSDKFPTEIHVKFSDFARELKDIT